MKLRYLHADQNPLILHVAGDWKSPIFGSVFKVARSTVPKIAVPEPCDEVTVVTWNNGVGTDKFEKPLGAFEESCSWWDVKPMVLGQDVPHPWSNREHKITTLIEALRNKIETPYVIGSDSGDSLLLGTPAEILRRFKKHFTADLVFMAGGPDTWPPVKSFKDFEKSVPWSRVSGCQIGLCPGTFIGKRDFCLELFETAYEMPIVPEYPHSEQATIKNVWPVFYPQVFLDYLSIMFQYWNGPHVLEIKYEAESS